MHSNSGAQQARQFVRKLTRRPARIEVHPDHADQFRLAFPDAQSDIYVVDVSRGGLGLHSSVYVPRNLRMTLHIAGMDEAASIRTRDLAIQVVSRRCNLADHRPTYLVGLQYLDVGMPDAQELIESVSRTNPPADGGAA